MFAPWWLLQVIRDIARFDADPRSTTNFCLVLTTNLVFTPSIFYRNPKKVEVEERIKSASSGDMLSNRGIEGVSNIGRTPFHLRLIVQINLNSLRGTSLVFLALFNFRLYRIDLRSCSVGQNRSLLGSAAFAAAMHSSQSFGGPSASLCRVWLANVP